MRANGCQPLLAVLEREPMVREAISEAFAELDADQPKREAELERIDAERRRTSESLERHDARVGLRATHR